MAFSSVPAVGIRSAAPPGFAAMMKGSRSLGSLAPQVGLFADLKRYQEKQEAAQRHRKRPAKPVRQEKQAAVQKRRSASGEKTPPRKASKARARRNSVRPQPQHHKAA